MVGFHDHKSILEHLLTEKDVGFSHFNILFSPIANILIQSNSRKPEAEEMTWKVKFWKKKHCSTPKGETYSPRIWTEKILEHASFA